MIPAYPRMLKPGDFAFIRVRLIRKSDEEWEVEPITKFGSPVVPGKYTYAEPREIVTVSEAKKAMRDTA